MCWKLAFVAAVALMLATVMPPLSVLALAQANIFVPPIEIAAPREYPERFAERPPVWTEDAIPSTWVAAQPDDVNQDRRLSPGAIIGLICAIAASSVALGIAFGLRRRIDRIAGPDP